MFLTILILAYFKREKETYLKVDASRGAILGILS
jgi:hypothetical protein